MRTRPMVCMLAVGAPRPRRRGGDDDDADTGSSADVTTAEASAAGRRDRGQRVPRPRHHGGHGGGDGRHRRRGDDRHRRRGQPAATTGEPVAADDSLEPVTFGFHNLEGGAISLPEIRLGFEEGIRYVNEELGGINGHPIEIESCNLEPTPESSVNCANQFVEAGVDVAVQGVDVAADAALPVLKQADIAEIALAAFTTRGQQQPRATRSSPWPRPRSSSAPT